MIHSNFKLYILQTHTYIYVYTELCICKSLTKNTKNTRPMNRNDKEMKKKKGEKRKEKWSNRSACNWG